MTPVSSGSCAIWGRFGRDTAAVSDRPRKGLTMTYLGAAGLADEAAKFARAARMHFQETGDENLATAIEKLAEAVSELASSMHRAN